MLLAKIFTIKSVVACWAYGSSSHQNYYYQIRGGGLGIWLIIASELLLSNPWWRVGHMAHHRIRIITIKSVVACWTYGSSSHQNYYYQIRGGVLGIWLIIASELLLSNPWWRVGHMAHHRIRIITIKSVVSCWAYGSSSHQNYYYQIRGGVLGIWLIIASELLLSNPWCRVGHMAHHRIRIITIKSVVACWAYGSSSHQNYYYQIRGGGLGIWLIIASELLLSNPWWRVGHMAHHRIRIITIKSVVASWAYGSSSHQNYYYQIRGGVLGIWLIIASELLLSNPWWQVGHMAHHRIRIITIKSVVACWAYGSSSHQNYYYQIRGGGLGIWLIIASELLLSNPWWRVGHMTHHRIRIITIKSVVAGWAYGSSSHQNYYYQIRGGGLGIWLIIALELLLSNPWWRVGHMAHHRIRIITNKSEVAGRAYGSSLHQKIVKNCKRD